MSVALGAEGERTLRRLFNDAEVVAVGRVERVMGREVTFTVERAARGKPPSAVTWHAPTPVAVGERYLVFLRARAGVPLAAWRVVKEQVEVPSDVKLPPQLSRGAIGVSGLEAALARWAPGAHPPTFRVEQVSCESCTLGARAAPLTRAQAEDCGAVVSGAKEEASALACVRRALAQRRPFRLLREETGFHGFRARALLLGDARGQHRLVVESSLSSSLCEGSVTVSRCTWDGEWCTAQEPPLERCEQRTVRKSVLGAAQPIARLRCAGRCVVAEPSLVLPGLTTPSDGLDYRCVPHDGVETLECRPDDALE